MPAPLRVEVSRHTSGRSRRGRRTREAIVLVHLVPLRTAFGWRSLRGGCCSSTTEVESPVTRRSAVGYEQRVTARIQSRRNTTRRELLRVSREPIELFHRRTVIWLTSLASCLVQKLKSSCISRRDQPAIGQAAGFRGERALQLFLSPRKRFLPRQD